MGEWTLKDIITVGLIYLGVAVTYIWLILKHFGYINTPWFVEAIPFVASSVAIFAFVYHACVFISQIRPLPKQVAALTKRMDKVEHTLEDFNDKFEHVDNDLEFLKKAVTR
jgi:hypothetical protein